MFKALRAVAATVTVVTALVFTGAKTVAQDTRTNDQAAPTASEPSRDDGFNYGWLGLAGLVGLLGLLPRDRSNGVTVRDGAGNVKNNRT